MIITKNYEYGEEKLKKNFIKLYYYNISWKSEVNKNNFGKIKKQFEDKAKKSHRSLKNVWSEKSKYSVNMLSLKN